jgi:hypothetical protein
MDLTKHAEAENGCPEDGDAHEDEMALVAARQSCPTEARHTTQHRRCTQKYQQPVPGRKKNTEPNTLQQFRKLKQRFTYWSFPELATRTSQERT